MRNRRFRHLGWAGGVNEKILETLPIVELEEIFFKKFQGGEISSRTNFRTNEKISCRTNFKIGEIS